MKKQLIFAAAAVLTLPMMASPDGDDDGTGAVVPGFEWDDWEEFEKASQVVENMGLGWNLGNTLDSNSGDKNNMWIELWTQKRPSDYETAWGQPVTTQALIHMMKEAGYNAIRVPVTWYPHMGTVTVNSQMDGQGNTVGVWDMSTWNGTTVNAEWMARVKEVVDYVIAEDMYCILNVHHDTGDASTAWIRADKDLFTEQQSRYESLWKQIAEQFRNYGEKLLFEGYNEMLDRYGSWCFASFATSNNYDQSVAESAYQGINNYAQSFVNTVRATGGNNLTRNLVVCTYGACSGGSSWSSHLQDPLKNMVVPSDSLSGHIIFEVHAYPSFKNYNEAKAGVDALFNDLTTYLQPKAPVIIGEWGTGSSDVTYAAKTQLLCDFAQYFCLQAKKKKIAPLYWMGLSDGAHRSVPEFNEPLLRDAMKAGFAGYEVGDPAGLESVESANCHTIGRKKLIGTEFVIEINGRCYNASGMNIY